MRGVRKYGTGNWAQILQDDNYTFNNRKGVDLKDKWRNLQKMGRQEALERELGDAPASSNKSARKRTRDFIDDGEEEAQSSGVDSSVELPEDIVRIARVLWVLLLTCVLV